MKCDLVCEQMPAAEPGGIVDELVDREANGCVVGRDDCARTGTGDDVDRNALRDERLQHAM